MSERTDAIDAAARILFLIRYRSRRAAKRELREAGGKGTADELNYFLNNLDKHPNREEIEHLADQLGAAHRAAENSPEPEVEQGTLHDEWIIGEGATSRRTYIIYIGVDTSFVGEVFDSIEDPPVNTEAYKLDEGQVLGNILWLDDPPSKRERFDLFEVAREKMRQYDAMLDKDLEEEV